MPKAKVSKRKVMKEAKRIYKSGKHTWAEALSLAWHQEKLNVGKTSRTRKGKR